MFYPLSPFTRCVFEGVPVGDAKAVCFHGMCCQSYRYDFAVESTANSLGKKPMAENTGKSFKKMVKGNGKF